MTADFGPTVTALVFAVTNGAGQNRRERQASTYPKIRATPGAKLLRLCDRLCNFQDCLDNNPRLLSMYVKEYPGFRQELYQSEKSPLSGSGWTGWLPRPGSFRVAANKVYEAAWATW